MQQNSLTKIHIRYFPPGLNLEIQTSNEQTIFQQLNLYGIHQIQKQNMTEYIQNTIIPQSPDLLQEYLQELTEAITSKIFVQDKIIVKCIEIFEKILIPRETEKFASVNEESINTQDQQDSPKNPNLNKSSKLHKPQKFHKQSIIRTHKQPLTKGLFSKYGQFFITSSYDRTCKIYQTKSQTHLSTLSAHTNAIFTIDISQHTSSNKLIATGSLDHTVKIWNFNNNNNNSGGNKKPLFNLIGHQAQVTNVEFNPNGQHLVSCGMDGMVNVWDLEKGKCVMNLKAAPNQSSSQQQQHLQEQSYQHDSSYCPLTGFQHNYYGDLIITSGFSKQSYIFDLKSQETIKTLWSPQQSGDITCAKFDQMTGEVCATAGTNGHTIIWDIGTTKPIICESFNDHNGEQILDINFNTYGDRLATCGSDSTIAVYNVNLGIMEHHITSGHSREITKVKWSPKGDYFLSVGFDGIGRVWDGVTGKNIDLLEGHNDEIYSCDINYWGDRILTCSKDGTCVVWKREEDEEKESDGKRGSKWSKN